MLDCGHRVAVVDEHSAFKTHGAHGDSGPNVKARRLIISAISAAVALGAAGVGARAETLQSAFTARDAFAPDLNQWGPQVARRSLQWDAKKGHWGLKLDLNQAVGRPLSYTDRDVQAGAYFKVTPSLSVGGAVSIGTVRNDQQSVIPADRPPQVRLETAFKF